MNRLKPTYEALAARVAELEEKFAQSGRPGSKDRDGGTLFETLFEQSAVGVARVMPDGRFREVNPPFCDIVGYTPHELSGMNFMDITHPDDLHLDEAEVARVFAGEIDSFEIEKRYIHKDGRTIWIQLFSNVVRDDTGAVLYAIAVIVDITARKQTEAALVESEQKWRNILVNTPQIGVSLDPAARIVFVNAHFLALTGWQEEEVLGRDWFDLFIPEHVREEVRQVFAAVMDQRDTFGFTTYENEILTRAGELRMVAWSNVLTKDARGRIVDVTCLGIDLTERKQAEAALKKSEENYRRIFENSVVGVFQSTPAGRFITVNRAFARMLRYDSPEDLVESITDIRSQYYANPEDRDRYRRVLEQKGEVDGFEFQVRCKDGAKIWVSNSTRAYFDEDGNVARYEGVVSDITGQKRLEAQLQQAQKMEAIGNLAGGIAHDFNNILFPIIGLSELLIEDLPPDSLPHENVREILKAGKRGGGLVNQILAFSRQSEQRATPVRLQKILKDVLKLSRSTVPADIDITGRIQADCGLVMADPTQVHQIAMNLITNAYHAVAPSGGGTISVSLAERDLAADAPEGLSLEPGAYAVLTVADTGGGIDPSIRDKIFDPYFTTKDKDKGTGLGLAVVYGIVKEAGGEVRVQSDLGKGAVFEVFLPLMEKSAPSRRSATAAPPIEGGTERILVVDDEEAIAALEKKMLEGLGYRVTSRVSSFEALAAFKAGPARFDLVITDMTMPHMTGVQLAKEVRTLRPDTPMIICTGFSERIDRGRAEALGIKGFLMKPVIRADMARTVRAVLDSRE